MRLKYQLFLTLLCVSAIFIALTFAVNSWSFNRGFLNYINRVQLQQLDSLSRVLAEHYAEHQSWRVLQNDRRQWRTILASGRLEPLPGDKPEQLSQSVDPQTSRRPQGPRPGVILADTEKQVIFGPRRLPKAMLWRPVNAGTEAVTVGYVGLPQRSDFSNDLDRVFSAQQKRSFAYVAAVMVLASALLAIILSDRLVRPLLVIQQAVKRISGGAFDHRLGLQRRDELGDLAQDINQLAQSLEKNSTARRQWLAEISHELRTPVAVLQSEIEAIQDGVITADEQSIASLHAETLRLSRLIHDLHELTLSDTRSLTYRISEVQFVSLIEERLKAHEAELNAQALKVRLDKPSGDIRMAGDADRLGQLIDNLLQNSIRYTDSPGQLIIVVQQLKNTILLDWQDSGPGVDSHHLPHLFDPLYRTEESRSRASGGAGLGLSIVQKIANAHHASIRARESGLGGLCVQINFAKS